VVIFEVHAGRDGRTYLLDMARAFPPEDPLVVKHLSYHPQVIFSRLLRPELLQHMKLKQLPALSSDSLSMWGHAPVF
jgi:hypothetical protein